MGPSGNKRRVLVGLSGGVDSSVAALLLLEQGYEVVGVSMKLWNDALPLPHAQGKTAAAVPRGDACFGPGEAADLEAAAALCSRLGIPYRQFDCSREYGRFILENFRSEYLAGRTPNPCVRCNAIVKFGFLPEAARAAGIPFDFFATGHYARVEPGPDGRMQLLRAADRGKDQSYFLYRLSQAQLLRQLFPLGNLRKTEVREKARAAGLAAADRPDSQDFYAGDRADLIGEPGRQGEFVDAAGQVLGHHDGYWQFTIGQRRGIGIARPEPYYVVAIDAARNRVVLGTEREAWVPSFVVRDLVWTSVEAPPAEAALKIRSGGEPVPGARLEPLPDGTLRVTPPAPGLRGVAPGQSAVFYDGDLLLGGGIIA
ncbi:MAG: tRNA 2-thiouridine(34) synthase MnmA [Kiritimatiellae bacterium]|nr:tRNA 2-thiouridine(34) synthase MnmA [Kiritimatiellia bacterium]